MPENYFAQRVAATYDQTWADMFAPEVVDPMIDLLASFAGGGSTLELGIGTGRVALPLAKRGVHVHGIDRSPEMVAQLRAKPASDSIEITIGDFTTATVDGSFSLAYIVFNTIENLSTQDDQVACFQNVTRHLEPGGHFVVEVEVPALQRLPPGESVRAFRLDADRLGFDEYHVASQGLVSHWYSLIDGRLDYVQVPFRYVWPAELDLMARLADMTLRERWAGWRREPFTDESSKHVSVYQKRVPEPEVA